MLFKGGTLSHSLISIFTSLYLWECLGDRDMTIMDSWEHIRSILIMFFLLKTPTAMHRRPLLLCSMPSEVCFENSTSEVYGRTWEYIQLPLVFLKSFLFDCNTVVCFSLVPWGCLFAPVFSKVGAVPLTL